MVPSQSGHLVLYKRENRAQDMEYIHTDPVTPVFPRVTQPCEELVLIFFDSDGDSAREFREIVSREEGRRVYRSLIYFYASRLRDNDSMFQSTKVSKLNAAQLFVSSGLISVDKRDLFTRRIRYLTTPILAIHN